MIERPAIGFESAAARRSRAPMITPMKTSRMQDELALRDQVGLAGLVDQLRDLEHRRVHRQVLEPVNVISPNSRPSAQTTRPPISSVRPLMPSELDRSTGPAAPGWLRRRAAPARLGLPAACASAAAGARPPAPPTPSRDDQPPTTSSARSRSSHLAARTRQPRAQSALSLDLDRKRRIIPGSPFRRDRRRSVPAPSAAAPCRRSGRSGCPLRP